MTYQSMWRRAYAGAKLAAVGAVVAGVMALSAPAQAALVITEKGTTTLNTIHDLFIGDVFGVDISGDAGDGGGSFWLGFTAKEDLVAIETNTFNPTAGFDNPYIAWTSDQAGNNVIDGQALNAAQLNASAGSSLSIILAQDQTAYLQVSWDGIVRNLSNWDIRVEAVPLPPALLLFLSGLAGIGFLGRVKSKRRERALAAA